MADSLFLSLQVVFPLCMLLAAGYVMKGWLKLSEVTTKQLNQMVFKVFLPLLLFRNIYTSDLKGDFDVRLLVFAICAILGMYIFLCLWIPRIESDRKKCSVMIQGIYRSNYVLYGIPITSAVFGGDNLGMASILAAVIIPLINVLAVFLFELFRGSRMNWGNALKGVATNPLVLSSAAGVVFLVCKLPLPKLVMDSVSTLGSIATPLALIALGAEFHFTSLKKYSRQLLIAVPGRLVIVPTMFLTLAVLCGFRGMHLVVLMALFASPAAVASYTMASTMGGDEELAGQILVLTTVFSVVTIFCYTFVLNSLRLI